jgi:putative hydrolase of the HAD superfamily
VPAFAFDLGDTLVEYEGVPLNWEAHYATALAALAASQGAAAGPGEISQASEVLRRYNTRLHPRTGEVTFATILEDVLPRLGVSGSRDELAAARAFFGVFRRTLRAFADASRTLERLRARGCAIGVFTDVPYGMPAELAREDVHDAGLQPLIDVFLTSRDVGRRKPAPATLAALATRLGCDPADMVHVGNERKDVDVARAVGCRAVLLDRGGRRPDWGQHRTIRSLDELEAAPPACTNAD